MTTRREHTNTFSATGDDGQEFTILEFTDFVECRDSEGYSIIPGLKSLYTSDGSSVNREGKGIYTLVGTQRIRLRSFDPDAP